MHLVHMLVAVVLGIWLIGCAVRDTIVDYPAVSAFVIIGAVGLAAYLRM